MPVVRRVLDSATTPIRGLATLLIDAVDGGASVGFLSPLTVDDATSYWREVAADVGIHRHLWVAEDGDRVVGSVQIAVCEKPNGRHRAELQKLLVARAHRGQGVATALMNAAENYAAELGLRLLILDTHAGSPAEAVYRHRGWNKVGEVPEYAGLPNGDLIATAYYYKLLPPRSAPSAHDP